MNIVDAIKKYDADKIVFLGLFAVTLLLARFIVTWRSAIVLSVPIELKYGGLSASIPTENGWKSEKQWEYYKNAFALSSFFDAGSGNMTASVRCRYILLPTTASVKALFDEKTSAIGGMIAQTGQIPIEGMSSGFAKSPEGAGVFLIDWIYIKKPERFLDMFFGVAQLPNGRRLDIEVYQEGYDDDLAERVFRDVAESIRLKDNPVFDAGCKVIGEIKNKGLAPPAGEAGLGGFSPLLFAEEAQKGGNFFLMKDARGRSVGFTMDVTIAASGLQQDGDAKGVEAASFDYIRSPFNREQATVFEGQNNLDEFTWKSEAGGIGGRSGAEMVLDKTGVMAVRKFGRIVEEASYHISPAAIPTIFDALAFSQIIDSNYEEILVDIIDADGTILPLLICKVERDDSAVERLFGKEPAREEVVYILKAELLDGRGFYDKVFLDERGRILKRLLKREAEYVFERSDAETIQREFPERSDYILQRNEMLR